MSQQSSATWPEGVRRLAGNYVEAPIQVFIGTLDLRAVESVYQLIEILATEGKFDRVSFTRSLTCKLVSLDVKNLKVLFPVHLLYCQ